MLKKHERARSGHLREIYVTEMRLDLVPDSKLFKSPSFCAGPKIRSLGRAEVQKQLPR